MSCNIIGGIAHLVFSVIDRYRLKPAEEYIIKRSLGISAAQNAVGAALTVRLIGDCKGVLKQQAVGIDEKEYLSVGRSGALITGG